ncbi:hypothetical protein QWY14_04160 [Planococcus sp. N028]|uniref:Tetratricopeptide repeat protein n=1 Tax=Planococcus shixiaomingii TaxID=3058393 RepID=A0ABT8MZR9_9BACL|nr:hypothetical protein [Planococcus sp. N028]MDN7240968.1 hypothetical protein [Planococcus sp. N028]
MKNKNSIVAEFIKHSLIAEQTQYSVDYRKGNKSQDALLAIRDGLKDDPELAKEVFDELLLHDNPYVLYVCSVYAIVLDHRKDDAIQMLEKIADMGNKLTSFEAKTALELVESGELFELHGASEKNVMETDNKMDLLIEVHERIEEYSKIGSILKNPDKLTEWDKITFSEEEMSALKATEFSSHSINGIEKIISERMLTLFFNFFAVVDGVGDPKLRKKEDVWLGFRLENKTEENDKGDENFLHDQLFEAYSKWLELKSNNP